VRSHLLNSSPSERQSVPCANISPSNWATTQRGATLRGAHLAYTTYGELNADKSNVIVYPTWHSGRHWDNEWLIGSGMALGPEHYFIIVPNMLGNGLSTSPSNTPPPYDRGPLPGHHRVRPGRRPAQAGHRGVRH
jgi:homoserine acetyltransferase